jgi:glycosyltransferase involved in cell wall biosynthesis
MAQSGMDTTVLLSAIVPVFTTEERFTYNEDLLKTFVNLPIEIIYVRTSERCYEEDLILRSKNLNYSIISLLGADPGQARNAGVAIAEGEWIAFWDSDDIPLIGNVLELLNRAILEDSTMAVGQYQIQDFETGHLSEPSANEEVDEIFAMNPGLWRCLFKSEIAKSNNFPNYRMAEDQVFLSSLDLDDLKISFSKEITYRYIRYRSGQLTESKAAIADLSKSILDTKQIIDVKGLSSFRLTSLIRQIITALLRGNAYTKIKTFKLVFNFLFVRRRLSLKLILLTMMKLNSSRRSS